MWDSSGGARANVSQRRPSEPHAHRQRAPAGPLIFTRALCSPLHAVPNGPYTGPVYSKRFAAGAIGLPGSDNCELALSHALLPGPVPCSRPPLPPPKSSQNAVSLSSLSPQTAVLTEPLIINPSARHPGAHHDSASQFKSSLIYLIDLT